MRLRPARADDMMLYFTWVNDPVVRKNAFQSEPIDFATHREWFANVIADENVQMWVLEVDDIPVGRVRRMFEGDGSRMQKESDGRTALIDYSVASEQRGHGYGQRMLALAEHEVTRRTILVGQVKEENIASRRTFLSLDYTESRVESGTFWEYRKQIV